MEAVQFQSRGRAKLALGQSHLQLETRENPQQRNDFCRAIITRKIEATIIPLENQFPARINGSGNEIGLCSVVSPRRKSTRRHFRIAHTGGQLRSFIFS
jgi:hypothetical protein